MGGEVANSQPDGITPLMRAARLGHEEVVTCLLEAHASIYRHDAHRWTALCHAAAGAELACVRLLLESGGAERQKTTANRLKTSILEACEENLDATSAAMIRKEFE